MAIYHASSDHNAQARPARSRRCKQCDTLNAARYLVCQECRTILSGSEWVDTPASETLEPRRVSNILDPFFEREAETAQRHFADKKLKTQEEASISQVDAVMNAPETITSEAARVVQPTEEAPIVNDYRQTIEIPALVLDISEDADMMDTQQVKILRKALEDKELAEMNAPDVSGSSIFENTMLLCMEIGDESNPPLILRLPQKRALIIGRDDPRSNERPDVDMLAYGGFQMGISRQHAALELNGKRLHIRDLGSSNGTFLNGFQIDSDDPHQLRDGDTIRLGNMTITISFRA